VVLGGSTVGARPDVADPSLGFQSKPLIMLLTVSSSRSSVLVAAELRRILAAARRADGDSRAL
jgi:hypothetical protein